ncbi:hypothetical protein SUDANB121_04827 [Nocardiopsis dassonvillei]|uniref:CPBP family intramembrane glutamic endopeptidase n=1 Tax=Nocardiopsis dassonvillei TaxID=2014 RepID=UPI003F54E2A6
MNRDDHPHPAPTAQPTGAPLPQEPGSAPVPPPAPPAPRRRGPRPVPAGVPYHRVLAGEKRRVWRGILAIVLLVVGMLLFSTVLTFLAVAVDALTGRADPASGEFELTPLLNASGLLAMALLTPWSMLIQRWLYGVRGASLHSVLACFRSEPFTRSLLVIGPVWVVYMTLFSFATPFEEGVWSTTDLFLSFGIIMLLVPLQAAGEEYGFRGLIFRVAGSWSRGPRAALVIGTTVSSLVFMAAHFAADPWLNLYYFTFGATLALITWRTGGLEVAVVIHAVNNTLAFLISVIIHSDLAAGFDRSAGVGSAIMLVPCGLLIAVTAVVWLRTRRTGPALTPGGAEAAAEPVA